MKSDLIKKLEDLEKQIFVMKEFDELNEKMDRIKVLMDATRMSMEELMTYTAPMHIECDSCPISEFCDQHPYNEVTKLGCCDIWALYLKGDNG